MEDLSEWNNDAVVPVLEVLEKSGIAVSAGAIQFELNREMRRPPSRSTITRAIQILREEGLITKPDPDSIYYELTGLGKEYTEEHDLSQTA